VEVNHAFSTYRLLERSVFESWEARTPAGFVVAVEARRYLTHLKRLRDDTHAWAPRGAVPFVRLLAQAGMTTALGQGRAAS